MLLFPKQQNGLRQPIANGEKPIHAPVTDRAQGDQPLLSVNTGTSMVDVQTFPFFRTSGSDYRPDRESPRDGPRAEKNGRSAAERGMRRVRTAGVGSGAAAAMSRSV